MRLAAKVAALFAAFALAVLLALRFWILPQLQSSGTTVAALKIAQAAIRFQKDHGFPPGQSSLNPPAPPDPATVTAALRGLDPPGKNYLHDFPESAFRDGTLIDSFGHPFRFGLDPQNFLTITSAGPNRKFGDSDDISDRTSTPSSP